MLLAGLALVVSAHPLDAQDRLRYREFQLGSGVAEVVKLTGSGPSDVADPSRPAMLQALEWRPRYVSQGSSSQADPVNRMVFSFYNDQLYKVLVDYDPRRTEGMTQADIVAAISSTYGPAVQAPPRLNPPAVQYGDPDMLLATWGDAESRLALFRASYPVKYRLTIESTHMASLAQVALVEAVRLDAREAPQRELERRQKEADNEKAAQEEAKRLNLPGFRP